MRENGISLSLNQMKYGPVWMSVQHGKWRVLSQSSSQFLGKVQGRGPQEDHHLDDLPSRVSAPAYEASGERE